SSAALIPPPCRAGSAETQGGFRAEPDRPMISAARVGLPGRHHPPARESIDMGRPRDDNLWALARAERAALAEDLAGLSPEQWRHGTLCGDWDVEHVVARLTATASLNQWQWLRS